MGPAGGVGAGNGASGAGTTAAAGTTTGGEPSSSGGTGAGTSGGASSDDGGDEHTGTIDSSTAPAFKPTLLVNTLVGGTSDQYVRSVGFGPNGEIWGKGKGFQLQYDAAGKTGSVSGDVNTSDTDNFRGNNKLENIGNELMDPRNGQTYTIGYKQVAATLQQPFLTSTAGWKFWGWSASQVGSLLADSRGYDLSLMPNGRIMALAWTDGGDSTLAKDPFDLSRDLAATQGALQSSAGGLASLYLLIDPAAGKPVSGTFLYTQCLNRTVDRYGRVYITDKISKNTAPKNPFNQPDGASAGLFVLTPDLKQEALNIVLGAACGKSGSSTLASVAVRNNILVMGGTSCESNIVPTDNAVQKTPGGGQDGYLVVIKLWD